MFLNEVSNIFFYRTALHIAVEKELYNSIFKIIIIWNLPSIILIPFIQMLLNKIVQIILPMKFIVIV